MKLNEFIYGLKGLSHSVDKVSINPLIDDLKKIEKAQKVTVPQFVADWYREHMDDLETALFRCVDIIPRVYEDGELNQFQEWFVSGKTKPFQTLVNMHQFGYEIEKEKRYTVKMRATKQPLFYNNMYEKTFFSLGDLATKFTRKQLEEAELDWVFDCDGVEVKEVEG